MAIFASWHMVLSRFNTVDFFVGTTTLPCTYLTQWHIPEENTKTASLNQAWKLKCRDDVWIHFLSERGCIKLLDLKWRSYSAVASTKAEIWLWNRLFVLKSDKHTTKKALTWILGIYLDFWVLVRYMHKYTSHKLSFQVPTTRHLWQNFALHVWL